MMLLLKHSHFNLSISNFDFLPKLSLNPLMLNYFIFSLNRLIIVYRMIIKISSWYNLYVDIWLEFDFYY